jgi:ribonuclease HI
MQTLSIYTDGSCEPNPGPGGWAAILVHEPQTTNPLVLRGSERSTTNNRMDFTAPFAALRWMIETGYSTATIFSDSEYVVNTMSSWVWAWEKKGYRKAKKNLDIIQPLHELQKNLFVKWKWVKGHSGNRWNERADEEAELARIHQLQHVLDISVPGELIK